MSDQLLPELWQMIMYALESDRDFQSFACVCRRFAALKRQFWANRMQAFDKRYGQGALKRVFWPQPEPQPKMMCVATSAWWVRRTLKAHKIEYSEDLHCDELASLTRSVYDWRSNLYPHLFAALRSPIFMYPSSSLEYAETCHCAYSNHFYELVNCIDPELMTADSKFQEQEVLFLIAWTLMVQSEYENIPVIRNRLEYRKKRCLKCNSSENVTTEVRQVRAADEPAITFAYCSTCTREWRITDIPWF